MYFLKRLLFLLPLLLLISFLAFLLVHATPGGPFDRERRPASPEIERALKARYHLDEPILKQYLRYLGLVWEKDHAGHWQDRKSTRLNSSHSQISYAVFCLKKKKRKKEAQAHGCKTEAHERMRVTARQECLDP